MIEQRRFTRVDFPCQVELTALPNGIPQAASSVDLSLGGVGVITQAAFPVGQTVAVTFFRKDRGHGEMKDQVVGRVVRLAADVDANKVGIQFLETLTEAEHPQLVENLLKV